ncbi:MAG: thermonuclease family protein [Bacilli bacterium]
MKLKKILVSLFAFAMMATLGGCREKNDTDEFIDYASATHYSDYNSDFDYVGHNFLDDGIGQVTLFNPVDGDTAHFHQIENNGGTSRLVKVRFYGIDTPESTGQIEEWGKKASKFTTENLLNAKTIVLTVPSLTYTPAEADSTGVRFKALVWISDKENATAEDLVCLNLLIVQEGFSNGKGVSECPMADVFNKADLQAQKFQKNMWSGEDPDFYRGEALITSIKDILEEYVENDGTCPTYEGIKVQINGIVVKKVDYDVYVVQDYEDEETGEITRYGMFIFAGYKSYECLKVGNDLTITGTFTVRYGNPQITSVSYNPYLPSDDDMVINAKGISKPAEVNTLAGIDGKLDVINNIYTFENLHATGKGYNEKDSTTLVESGAMSIEVTDETETIKIYLRVPKDVWLMQKDGGSMDRVESYDYLYKGGYHFNLTAAVVIYEPNSGVDSVLGATTSRYWQLTLCDKADFVYLD